jgi:hypothetical protein
MRPPHSLLIQCRRGLPIWRDRNFRERREPGALPPRNAEKRQYQEVGQPRKMGKNGSDFKALMPIAAFFFRAKIMKGPLTFKIRPVTAFFSSARLRPAAQI